MLCEDFSGTPCEITFIRNKTPTTYSRHTISRFNSMFVSKVNGINVTISAGNCRKHLYSFHQMNCSMIHHISHVYRAAENWTKNKTHLGEAHLVQVVPITSLNWIK